MLMRKGEGKERRTSMPLSGRGKRADPSEKRKDDLLEEGRKRSVALES